MWCKMVMKQNRIILILVIVGIFFIAGCSTTETQLGLGDGSGVGTGGGLTEEKIQASIDACSDLASGDVCALTTPRGEVPGTCTQIEDVLRCVGDTQNKLN